MEFSLNKASKKIDLSKISLAKIINALNLIGFEVDDLIQETDHLSNTKNIKLIIKVPADRPDLLVESFLVKDFANLFNAPLLSLSKNLSPVYLSNTKQKKLRSFHENNLSIPQNVKPFFTSILGIKILNSAFSPIWIQKQLQRIGIVPKNNIKDVFSLVNYEWGHNFNSFLIHGLKLKNQNSFFIKELEKAEKFLDTLIGKGTLTLVNKSEEIVAVFGYNNNFVQTSKNNEIIYLYSYISDSPITFLQSNSIYLKNISVKEFKKAYAETLKQAFSRLLTILELSYASNEISYFTQTAPPELSFYKIIKLDKDSGENILGIKTYDLLIFKKAGLKLICETPKTLYFSIPYNRKDLSRPVDLIEEYSRFFGYKNFSQKVPFKNLAYSKKSFHNISLIKQFFFNYGFSEVATNPLENMSKKGEDSIELENPLNSEISILHKSLIHKLFDLFEKNLRVNNDEKNYFEISRVFHRANSNFYETDKLAGIFQNYDYYSSSNSNLEFFYAKGLLESFLANFDFKEIIIKKQRKYSSIFHKTKTIAIYSQNKCVGIFGEISPLYIKKANLKRKLYLFEFDLFYFTRKKIASKIRRIEDWTKKAFITKDLSFFIDKNVDFRALKDNIQSVSSDINSVEFFDIYIEPDSKELISIGIRLIYSFTTQASQIEKINHEILEILKATYKSKLK